MTERHPRPHRQVVSYVRRSPRMNPSQERAWAALQHLLVDVPRDETSTSVAPDAPELDLPQVFGRTAPLYVEVGSGTGDSPVAFAAAHADVDVLAFEVFEPAVASTMSKARAAGVANLRLAVADGVAGLERLLPPSSVTALRTFFPDPWQKARHHKRRLVNPGFVDVVASRLVPGGQWFIATDWGDYAEHIAEVMAADARFIGGVAERDAERPLTKYESRGIAQGREIVDFRYTLIGSGSSKAADPHDTRANAVANTADGRRAGITVRAVADKTPHDGADA